MTGVGVIGLGAISRFYLRALAARSDVRVAAVCDLDPAKARSTPDGAVFHEDYHAVLTADDVDVVIVNLPNRLHFPVCRDALLAGKHVCCEKPLAVHPAEAAELHALALRADRTLFTAFHRRYNTNVLRLRDRLRGRSAPERAVLTYHERIEDHCGTDAWYLDPNQCDGCLADNGPNAFDTALLLLGEVRVHGAELHRGSDGVDRRAVVELRTTGGSEVLVRLDWAFPDGEDKAVAVEWSDGSRDGADMLAGFTEFKSSLRHEYEGVVDDFLRTVVERRPRRDTGLEVVDLVATAYRLAGRGVS